MEIKLDKAFIESLKKGFHQLRHENEDFSYKYKENEFMAWFREIILPMLEGGKNV